MTADTGPVPPLVIALDILLQQVAAASPEDRALLITCRLCRNNVLYLLDTLPGEDPDHIARFFAVRIRLAESRHHEVNHADPFHPDNRVPQIRGILW
jgi:hypothetical protein